MISGYIYFEENVMIVELHLYAGDLCVPAGEVEEPGDLLHAEVPLRGHGGPAGWAVWEAGETVRTYQVTLNTSQRDTLLKGRVMYRVTG